LKKRSVRLQASSAGAATPAEADRSHPAVAALSVVEQAQHRHRGGGRPAEVELADRLARRVLVRGGAARRGQEIGRDGVVARDRQPPRNVADMVVQPAILVDHHDRRAGAARARLGDIGGIKRVVADPEQRGGARPDPPVVCGDNRCCCGRCGDGADQRLGGGDAPGERDHPRHEDPPLHPLMREPVVERDGLSTNGLVPPAHAGCGAGGSAFSISCWSIIFALL
jgi:hypothetical protein